MAGRKPTTPKTTTKPAETGEPEAQTAKAIAPAADKPRTIRSICEEGLLAALPYDQIIANVKAIYPAAVTTPGCVAWYRSKMVKKGLVPSGKEMAAARKQAAAQAEAAVSGEQ